MASRDRLYTLHDEIFVVARDRTEAALFLGTRGLYVAEEDRWDPDDEGDVSDWLTLVNPGDEVALEDENGDVYVQTARTFAEAAPTGFIVDERYEDE